jgi:ribosomal protein S18 acetylase RimI-like enzyme
MQPSFRKASDLGIEEDLVCRLLPWVCAAGNPYFDFLFGGAEKTPQVLGDWLRRPSSEVSILRASIMLLGSEVAGAFIALGGADLRKARKADTIALAKVGDPSERSALLRRLGNCTQLFSPVADEEYYLSKVAVKPQLRGRGFSSLLVRQFLDEGSGLGFKRYRLDVHVENEPAIRCYKALGCGIDQTRESQDGSLKYHSMAYEQSNR